MTAFIASNSSEAVGVIGTGGDEGLTQWTADLAKEYSPIPAKFYELAEYVLLSALPKPALWQVLTVAQQHGF